MGLYGGLESGGESFVETEEGGYGRMIRRLGKQRQGEGRGGKV
jgi:hypothetical protein